jgi:hypothetical protein
MAKFHLTGPDGSEYEVNAPDDASEKDVLDVASRHFTQAAADRKEMERIADPTAGMSGLEKAAAGAGKFVSDTALGGKQLLNQVLGTGDREALNAEAAESRRLDKPLMDTGAGKAGYIAPALATALIPGANSVAGAAAVGASMGALQPTTEDESRLKNTAVSATLGAAGQKIGEKATGWIARKLSERAAGRAAAEAANAPRDAALAAGKEAGYVVPPVQANPSLVNKTLEGVAGKASTAQAASLQNQQVTNRLTALGLRLPHDEPITPEALKAVRETAGKAYEKIANGKFVADDTYKKGIEALSVSQRNLAEQVPELANKDVIALAQSLNKDKFDGRTLVESLKALRDRATSAFRAGETQAGRFYKGAAREIEDLIERNLLYTGAGGKKAVTELRKARQLIAKSHAAEAALNPATGNIDAKKFADAVRRGKPVSDEMRTVGEFAGAFPKATQLPERIGSSPGTSPLDAAVAVLKGGAAGALTLGARPAARALILSNAFQKFSATPRYGAPVVDQLGDAAVRNNLITRAARAALPGAESTSKASSY